jgi:hypothetical protein
MSSHMRRRIPGHAFFPRLLHHAADAHAAVGNGHMPVFPRVEQPYPLLQVSLFARAHTHRPWARRRHSRAQTQARTQTHTHKHLRIHIHNHMEAHKRRCTKNQRTMATQTCTHALTLSLARALSITLPPPCLSLARSLARSLSLRHMTEPAWHRQWTAQAKAQQPLQLPPPLPRHLCQVLLLFRLWPQQHHARSRRQPRPSNLASPPWPLPLPPRLCQGPARLARLLGRCADWP